MKIFKNGIPIVPVLALLLLLSWATILYSQGYRVNLNKKQVTVTQTGILSLRSIPEGAKVYLNGKITTATNSTVSSLAPGSYKIEIKKEGFTDWEKTVEVFNDKVTDITALLISKSPRIEPLTTYGVAAFSMSNDGTKIAYATKNGKEPGIWILPLSGASSISIFGGNRNLLVADSSSIAYSLAKSISWSPDDKEILIKMSEDKYYLVAVGGSVNQIPLEDINDPKTIYGSWDQIRKDTLAKYVEKLNIPQVLIPIASNPASVWSPDFKKFFVKVPVAEGKVLYKIYNFEDPLPVGEEKEYSPLKVGVADNISVFWYSDSYHLVVEENQTVEIVRIDGSNRTEIFTGSLASPLAYPTPSGDKIIILVSFKQSVPPDLYTVSIR
ncbi:hypothetical protein COT49_00015 [candidate division WWE3 bacterium CG08_land_8_20_14_0_20_40_13]|uniref:PEGA domain-containing protein n=1 Tax=candidate division WWE3 bacterium CG08_land_8_20_14_0_20_40_13 TaxID=1975084 RepID=A0A2H0XET3_UNCKA|nr:MAG: hypothetical protein COT49_00015 [candidate division WWE3 bacterium CG08_land_8_20_14_0_20_40_13]